MYGFGLVLGGGGGKRAVVDVVGVVRSRIEKVLNRDEGV